MSSGTDEFPAPRYGVAVVELYGLIGTFAEIPDRGTAYDVVIVGAGAAGLVIAHALAGSKLRVAVLEAGGARKTKRSQAFYHGEVADPTVHPWIHHYRVRALGGSSRIWGGRAIPFDPIDFERREWVTGSGWPFSIDEVRPYYDRALMEAEAGRNAFDCASALPGAQADFIAGLDGEFIETTIERFSRPTNFWSRYGTALSLAGNVDVFTETAAVEIRLDPEGRAVAGIDVAVPDGPRKTVRGTRYVLALGGLETTRLLLASNALHGSGIGNHSDHLGRNYMGHLGTTAGTVTFAGSPDGVAYDYARDADGIYVRRRLWLTEAAQRQFKLLNTTFRTHLPEPGNPSHGDPILSAMFLVKDLVLYEYSRKFSENPTTWLDRYRHVMNIVKNPLRFASFAARWTRDRNFSSRKIPSVVIGSTINRYELEFHAEQAPNPDSRLTLSQDRDPLGMPRLKVDWRTTQIDKDSLVASYRLLASELERTRTGRLDFTHESLLERAGKHGIVGGHHIGTTRMSADPKDGVVAPDLSVHGVPNLFVASASVFPTSGQANPTLTLLALGLRLADKLRADLTRAKAA